MKKIMQISVLMGLFGFSQFDFDPAIVNQGDKYSSAKHENKEKFLKNARIYLSIPYHFGGRLTKSNPGLDCLGLMFLSYSKTFGKNWKEFSVNPSIIVKKEQLGKPVDGLDGILSENVEISELEEGDIIYLLTRNKIEDMPLANLNGIDYWPWHAGIYSDKEKNLFLEANPLYGVIEHDFKDVLNGNEAIFVTRIF